jgi:hypothetical protein
MSLKVGLLRAAFRRAASSVWVGSRSNPSRAFALGAARRGPNGGARGRNRDDDGADENPPRPAVGVLNCLPEADNRSFRAADQMGCLALEKSSSINPRWNIMSYDLVVFEPAAAPHERVVFMDWYAQQTEWKEGHTYDDPTVSSPSLRAWFMEMIQQFPPMNGPLSRRDLPEKDLATETDYSIGTNVIYAAFARSFVGKAYTVMFELAQKHGIGFYDVSDDGDVWFPVNGKLVVAFRN